MDNIPSVLDVPIPRNGLYRLLGLGVLLASKLRSRLGGSVKARTFPVAQVEQAIRYDLSVINNWLRFLTSYSGKEASLRGSTILEVGPGQDLGVGLLCLWHGARRYHAIDINNLVETVPDLFYEALFDHMDHQDGFGKGSTAFLSNCHEITFTFSLSMIYCCHGERFDQKTI